MQNETSSDMLGSRSGSGMYLSINANGKIVQRVPDGTPNSVSRVNKNGNQVSELYHDFLKGTITSIHSEDSAYGRQWKIFVEKGGKTAILTLSYTSNYAKAFLKMLPNVDLSKEVEICPDAKEENGTPKTSLFLRQDGKLVPYAFTNDRPNGMPERKLVTVQGKDVWDYTDQLKFLEECAQKHLGTKPVSVDDIASDDEPF